MLFTKAAYDVPAILAHTGIVFQGLKGRHHDQAHGAHRMRGHAGCTGSGYCRCRIFNHIGGGWLRIKRMMMTRGVANTDGQRNGGCIQSSGSVEIVLTCLSRCSAWDSNSTWQGSEGAIYVAKDIRMIRGVLVNNRARWDGGAVLTNGNFSHLSAAYPTTRTS